jgi:hypothetical protein
MAPLLLPITVLALGPGGAQGAPPVPVVAPPVAGRYAGQTEQDEAIAIRVRRGARSASWRLRYEGRCSDGVGIRGGYRSGDGTPLLELGRDGSFRVAGAEPAPFRGGRTGRARFELSGRLGPEGGTGTWRIEVVPPRANGASVTCTSGPVRFGVAKTQR